MTPKQKRAALVRSIEIRITKARVIWAACGAPYQTSEILARNYRNLAAEVSNIALKAAELAAHDKEHDE